MTLPEWDIEQERYWQVATVNSILEYIVYPCALVEEKFQDICFGKVYLFSFVRRVWFDALPGIQYGQKNWTH